MHIIVDVDVYVVVVVLVVVVVDVGEVLVVVVAVLGGFMISELRHRTVASARAARPITAPMCPALPRPIVTPLQMAAVSAPACPAKDHNRAIKGHCRRDS